MKANEFIVEVGNLGPVDQIRTSMYRNLGIGGSAANEIASRDNFIERFMQQVKQNQKSSGSSGMPLNMENLVQSYMGKYGWIANPEQQAQLSKLAADVSNERGAMGGAALYAPKLKKLANAMYMIGSQQLRDPKTGVVAGGSRSGNSGTTIGAPVDKKEELSPITDQVIQRIQKLLGPENNDDLEKIAKTAMQVLYKQNPTAYTDLYKEIMSGSTKKKPEDTDDNPNLVRGANESRRR